MKTAAIRGDSLEKNEIFNPASSRNRDNCLEPYIKLRQNLLSVGILLDTCDIKHDGGVEIEIHQDVQSHTLAPVNYLLLFETPNIIPANGLESNWARYNIVFTWRDDLVDGKRFRKLNFPNPIIVPDIDGWSKRPQFCCMIAGNKSLQKHDSRDLYIERLRDIRWFERLHPNELDLYGTGWDVPPFGNGTIGKIMRRLYRTLPARMRRSPFPSYRGTIKSKRDALLRTRFSICYENVSDYPGYITEKIFDCFFSGCVPVYWGASNVQSYIPSSCFIDRRLFADTESVYKFIKSVTEEQYYTYQSNIANFLASDAAKPFGSEVFAETIANAMVADLGR